MPFIETLPWPNWPIAFLHFYVLHVHVYRVFKLSILKPQNRWPGRFCYEEFNIIYFNSTKTIDTWISINQYFLYHVWDIWSIFMEMPDLLYACKGFDTIQIMNGHECDGTDIFMRWKMVCSIQQGKVKLIRTFHLSTNENICTITWMKNIHYLFHITTKWYLCHLQRFILFWSCHVRSKVTPFTI